MSLARTRLAGHGLVVTPHEGVRVERALGGPETVLRFARGETVETVDLRAEAGGGSALADVGIGSVRGAWRIQTEHFTCAWPDGFALHEDPDGASPFLLVGPGSALVWASGPLPRAVATPIEALVGDDQRVRAVAEQGENARIDLDYELDDELWWQRRYALVWGPGRVLVLSAQALAVDEDAASAAVDALAHGIEPYRPD